MLQFPLRKMSVTDGSTGGVNQSEPLEEHGNFLQENNKENTSISLVIIDSSPPGSIIVCIIFSLILITIAVWCGEKKKTQESITATGYHTVCPLSINNVSHKYYILKTAG